MTTSWIILVVFVLMGITLTGVFQLMQLRIVENIAQKIFSRASFEFAYRIPRIKYRELYRYYAPELANRFFDTLTIQKGLPKILIDFSLAAFQIIAGLIVLSMYHSFFIVFADRKPNCPMHILKDRFDGRLNVTARISISTDSLADHAPREKPRSGQDSNFF